MAGVNIIKGKELYATYTLLLGNMLNYLKERKDSANGKYRTPYSVESS